MDRKDIYKAILEFSPSVVVCLSPDRKIVEFNAEAERLYGVKREDVIGKDYFVLFLPPAIWEAVDDDMKKVLSGRPSRGFENPVITNEGEEYILSWSVNRVTDSKGEPAGMIAIGQDITARKKTEEQIIKLNELEQKLHNMTVSDDLTGLFNRYGFYALAEKEFKVANRNKRRISLLLLDLNNMKSINAMFGQPAADIALTDAASILRKSFRESDIMGRTGKDAFAVLITDASEPDIENILRRHIKNRLNALNKTAGRDFMLQFSIGMAHYDPDSPCSLNELISQAEALMRLDKKRLQLTKEIWLSSDREKRKFKRFIVDDTITAELDGRGTFQVKDISAGGICIKTPKKIALNIACEVTVFSQARSKITPTGVVVWSSADKAAENAYLYETGIKFVKMQDKVKKYLDSIYEKSGL